MTPLDTALEDVAHEAGWLHLEAAPVTDGTDNYLVGGLRWRALGAALTRLYAARKAARRSEAEQPRLLDVA